MLTVDRRDRLDGPVDVLDGGAARRDDHRLPERRDVPQERRVPQVARGDLVGGQLELREQVGARLVERSREEDEPELVRDAAELRERGSIELERLAVPAVGRAEAVLVVVRAVVQRAREERAVVALLELDRVDAHVLRRVEQLDRLLDASLVVVADLRDDEARRVVRDPASVDRQLAHRAMVAPRAAAPRAPRRPCHGCGRVAPSRPVPCSALSGALGIVLLAVGIALLGTTTGGLGAACLGARSAAELLLAAYVVGGAQLVLVVLVLSPPGLVTRWWLVGGLVATTAAAALVWNRRGRPRPPATSTGARWAVLPLAAGGKRGWCIAFRSPPWAIQRRVPDDAGCG